MKKSFTLLFFLALFISSNGQTPEERKKIVDGYNQTKSETLIKELEAESKAREERLNGFISKNPGILRSGATKNGAYIQLVDVDTDGSPVYYTTSNLTSASTIRTSALYQGGSLGLDLEGQNMIAGVWDGGKVLGTHTEFKGTDGSKIVFGDGIAGTILWHSTHVVGTVTAKGANIEARGLAPKSKVHAYEWTNDIVEMGIFARKGYLVSNHSYNSLLSGDKEWEFGAYNKIASQWDNLSYTYPKYQLVNSIGNFREDWKKLNPNKNGYEILSGSAVAKNTLTVGAIERITDYSPETIVLGVFSSPGPTDDGRIKPNLVAKGVDVYSTMASNNNSYGVQSGTSMAAPAVTAGILLIQELHNNLYGSYMNSATVRGVLQHTALEAGVNDGPDYDMGWGVANFEDAAKAIIDKQRGSIFISNSVIEENTLKNGDVYIKSLYVRESEEPMRVSISWTDPVGPENKDQIIDWDVKSLVNDLDVVVEDENGNIYYPWKLDKDNPANAATTGDNDVDNFERIDIKNPSGKYLITVSHKGELAAPQDYTLVVTGKDLEGPMSINEDTAAGLSAWVYPNPAKSVLNIKVDEVVDCKLYNLLGSVVYSTSFDAGHNQIDVSPFKSGTYLLKLTGKTSTKTEIVIVE